MSQPNYIEFSHPKLVSIYNSVNGIDEYRDFYIQLAKQLNANTIIDIGCGSGLLTCPLAEQDYTMIGIEPSKEMLELAKNSKCGDTVKWLHGTAKNLPKLDADMAIMTGHVAQFHLTDSDWQLALQSIHSSLKRGGYLAFESRNPDVQPWFNNKQHIDWPTKSSPRIVNHPTEGEVHWWMNMLEVKDNTTLYEIHYLFLNTNEELVSVNKLRFRSKKEITDSLEETGFKVDTVYGNWDFSLADEISPEFIFVASAV